MTSSIRRRLARPGSVLFSDDPSALRTLSLWMYLAVGPVFLVMLWVEAHGSQQVPAVAAVGALILAGLALLVVMRPPRTPPWIFTAGFVPIVSCGIAYWATGDDGGAFLAIMLAPLAWASVLFEAPVVIGTLVIALATHTIVVHRPDGLLDLVANTLVFMTVSGLVALVGYSKSAALRAARSEARAAEARTRALLDTIPDVVGRADADGRFLEIRAPGGSLPLATAEYLGRRVYDFLPAEAHEEMRLAIARALETGELQHVRYTIPDPDRPVTIESRIARSTPDEVVVIRQDISDRLRSEREHRYLAALVGQMNESVIVVDPEGTVTLWSPGAERLYGWTAAEAVGNNIGPMILPGTTPEAFAAITAENIALGRSQKTVVRQTKDGRTIVVEASFTALTDADGHPTGLLTVSRDVTAAETAHERALDDARLRGLAERMNEIEIVVGPDGALVHANDRALEAYGYTRDELQGLTIADLRDPVTLPEMAGQMARAAEAGTRFTTVHRRKDGTTFPVEVSSRGFAIGGASYLHSLVRDMTIQRRMEADQKRMLDELLAAVASVRTLSGLLPICMYCKKIRNDQGYWDRIEKYISEHSNAELSHGMCPDCYARYVEPELRGLDRMDTEAASAEERPPA